MFRHASWAATLLAGAVLTGGCGGGNDRAAEMRAPTTDDLSRAGARDEAQRTGGDELTVRGCLTGTEGRFALTVTPETMGSVASRTAAGDERDTHTYALVGGTNLQAHLGRQVEVTGTVAGRGREVEVDQTESSRQPTGTTGTGEQVTPKVESKTEIEVQARQLTVRSVRSLDQPCATTGR
jgi:hypothetical protein